MKRLFLALICAWLVTAAGWPQANAATPQQVAVVLSSQQGIYPGAVVALDFAGSGCQGATQCYRVGGTSTSTFTALSGVTVNRASSGYATDTAGNLTLFGSNVPRITTAGLLVEEARTNLALQSQTLDNASWAKGGTTVTANAINAPDGTLTADLLQSSISGSGTRYTNQAFTITSGQNYAVSAYAKPGGVNFVYVMFAQAGLNYIGAVFNVQTCQVTQTSVGPTSGTIAATYATPMANGWCRVTLVGSINNNSGIFHFELTNSGTGNSINTSGDLTYTGTTSDSVYLWGAQTESTGTSTFGTSYIPTTTASVTRAADDITLGGLVINPNALTMALDAAYVPGAAINSTSGDAVSLKNSTTNFYKIDINNSSGTAGQYRMSSTSGGVGSGSVTATSSSFVVGDSTTVYRTAVAVAPSDMAISTQGMPADTGVTNTPPTITLTTLGVGQNASGTTAKGLVIPRILIYPQRLSNNQLQAVSAAPGAAALDLNFQTQTYRNTAGYARTNLILQSQTYDNASWVKTNSSITADTTAAPDGTTTADKLVEAATNTSHSLKQVITSVSGTPYVFSIYAKAAGRTVAILQLFDGASVNITPGVNLSACAVIQDSGVAVQASNVGNGWCRFSFKATPGTTSLQYLIYPTNDPTGVNNVYLGDGVSGIYTWGSQLEANGAVGTYVATTATTAQASTYAATSNLGDVGALTITRASSGYADDLGGNLISFSANGARITNKGLLVEEARTNALLQSQTFSNASWSKTALAVTANTLTAPDGTVTGSTITASAGAGGHYLAQGLTNGGATNYTISAYVKPGTTNFVYLNLENIPNTYVTAVFNASTCAMTQTSVGSTSGTVASTSATPMVNGWCRITLTGNMTSANANAFYGPAPAGTGNVFDTQGFVTFSAAGTETFGIWGSQFETGSFPTSYIVTTTATATRPADTFNLAGLSQVSPFSVMLGSQGAPGPSDLVGLGTASNNASGFRSSGGSSFDGRVFVNEAGVPSMDSPAGTAIALNTPFVIAARLKLNASIGSLNGTIGTQDTSTNPPTVNEVRFRTWGIGGNGYSGYITRLTIYPYAANDNELQYRTVGNW